MPWGWTLANQLVFKKVRDNLGFTRCRLFIVGAAPTHREVFEFFMSLNIPILELYGMSECTGPHTSNIYSAWRVGTVGMDMLGAKTKIDQPDENGEGEVGGVV